MIETNINRLSRWMACHSPRPSDRIMSDVSSTTSTRYSATMPHATAPGRHCDA